MFRSFMAPVTPASSRKRFSAEALDTFDRCIESGWMTEANITNIPKTHLSVIDNEACLAPLRLNVFSLTEFNNIQPDRIQYLTNSSCISFLETKRFLLSDLNQIEPSKLPLVFTEDCYNAVKNNKTTFTQLMRMSVEDIEEGNRTGNYANDARSMLCEFDLASTDELEHLSDTTLDHIIGVGISSLQEGFYTHHT
ncbi:MAG: hypothetical protein K0U37_06090 [Gammaproteobacteria bacterium]|nr:hypothetical protein [Gammaproteobacteria bacterium]